MYGILVSSWGATWVLRALGGEAREWRITEVCNLRRRRRAGDRTCQAMERVAEGGKQERCMQHSWENSIRLYAENGWGPQ